MNLMELFIKIGLQDEASGKIGTISNAIGTGLQSAARVGLAAVGAVGAAVGAITKQSIDSFAEYEQLAGGAAKIFDEMDQTAILADAQSAYKDLNLSANQYLAVINDVGAAFSATMGDAAGYETAKQGLQAISDYASGTGKNVDLLSEKFMMITRSTASYQSIADQFSGILPATSAAFLEQAQAAGVLSDSYTSLTEVPIEEYQAAVTSMLASGVDALGLTGNTAAEAFSTISGSLSATKSAWTNLVTAFADEGGDLQGAFNSFVESAGAVVSNVLPRIATIRDSLISLVVDNAPQIIAAGAEMISGFAGGIIEGIPAIVEKAPEVLSQFAEAVTENLPTVLDSGVESINEFVNGIISGIPDMVARIPEIIHSFVTFFVENGTTIMEAGFDVLVNLAVGIINAIPELVARLPQIIETFVATISDNLPAILATGFDMLMELLDGIFSAVPDLVEKLPEIGQSILDGLEAALSGVIEIGENIVRGLWDGIQNMAGWIGEKVSGFLDGLFAGAEEHEEIHSPSRKWARFGGNMAAGIGVGWDEEFGGVMAGIENSLNLPTQSVDFSGSGLGNSSAGIVNGINSGAVGGATAQTITVNLMMPDGTQFASYILGPLADFAAANGTPLLRPS